MNVSPVNVTRIPAPAAPTAPPPAPCVAEDPRDAVSLRGPAGERRVAAEVAAPAAPAAPVLPLAAGATPSVLLAEEPARALPAPVVKGIDRGNMDPSVPAGTDFYRHAVGGYLKSHPIPADRASYGIDAELQENTRKQLRGILDELSAGTGHPAGSIEQKLSDFYAAAMDEAAIEARGAAPVEPLLARIAGISSVEGLQDEVALLHGQGIPAMFSFYSTQDARNSAMMIGELSQGGLGLPERDYYLKDEPDAKRVLGAYREHIGRMFTLLGRSDGAEVAQSVLKVETALAAVSKSRVDMRDPQALYNLKDSAGLAGMTPDFSWDRYFAAVGQPGLGSVNVTTPDFFLGLNAALGAVSLDDWKAYLSWKVLDSMAPHLSKPFAAQDFEFSGKVLRGLEQQPERWKEMVGLTDSCLGEALGQKYVERHFPPEAKGRVLEMVDNIKDALREKVQGLSWMDDETKAAAREKIDTFTAKIGYPDKWTQYDFEVRRDDFAGNVLRAQAFAVRDNLAEIGRPVNRDKWYMTPSTINAYYSPTTNEIVFPAAILQPPYFDLDADEAMNYGGIGATIGHELSHGFDDEGAQFDKDGNLRNWWTQGSLDRFRVKADGVIRQFDEFVYDGMPVNGKLVAGESIADLGGLELAHAALARARSRRATTCDDGFTSDQRFYLSYALSWATNMRPEYAKLILQTDPHPLPEFRVNGPLANLPSFRAAFGLQPGEPMVRPDEKRNSIWD